MLDRKPTFTESHLIRALIILYVEDDADAMAVSEASGCSLDEVHDFMREAL
jgi:hypothetical protein